MIYQKKKFLKFVSDTILQQKQQNLQQIKANLGIIISFLCNFSKNFSISRKIY